MWISLGRKGGKGWEEEEEEEKTVKGLSLKVVVHLLVKGNVEEEGGKGWEKSETIVES